MDPSNSSSESDHDNRLWEHGDDNSLTSGTSSSSLDLDASSTSEIIPSLSSSKPLTPGLSSPMRTMEVSSQEPRLFSPESCSMPVPRRKKRRMSRRYKFHGNRYTKTSSQLGELSSMDSSFVTQSKSKRTSLKLSLYGYTSRISEPFPHVKRVVQFDTDIETKSIKSSIPTGMSCLTSGY